MIKDPSTKALLALFAVTLIVLLAAVGACIHQQERRAAEYQADSEIHDYKITQNGNVWWSNGRPYIETYRSFGRVVFTDDLSGFTIEITGPCVVEQFAEGTGPKSSVCPQQ